MDIDWRQKTVKDADAPLNRIDPGHVTGYHKNRHCSTQNGREFLRDDYQRLNAGHRHRRSDEIHEERKIGNNPENDHKVVHDEVRANPVSIFCAFVRKSSENFAQQKIAVHF